MDSLPEDSNKLELDQLSIIVYRLSTSAVSWPNWLTINFSISWPVFGFSLHHGCLRLPYYCAATIYCIYHFHRIESDELLKWCIVSMENGKGGNNTNKLKLKLSYIRMTYDNERSNPTSRAIYSIGKIADIYGLSYEYLHQFRLIILGEDNPNHIASSNPKSTTVTFTLSPSKLKFERWPAAKGSNLCLTVIERKMLDQWHKMLWILP